jgi:hypothetical protein
VAKCTPPIKLPASWAKQVFFLFTGFWGGGGPRHHEARNRTNGLYGFAPGSGSRPMLRQDSSLTRVASRCVQAFTGRMPMTKPSISLSAVSLETRGPGFGAPDLTELRTVVTPFPKNAGERDCYRYLLEQMQSTGGHPRATKGEFEKTCRRRFRVTRSSFESCWREAIRASGASWDQPGRRPR